jgi:hypothetical protein
MDEQERTALPDDVRDGDVLVYMSGRLLVVDHLVPEAFTVDLVEVAEADARSAARAEPAEVAVVVPPGLDRAEPVTREIGREEHVLLTPELEQ